MKRTLAKIGNSAHRAIIRIDHDGPALSGAGNIDYACPHCGRTLAEHVEDERVYDIVLECHGCKLASEFPRLPPGSTIPGPYMYFPEGVYRVTATLPVGRGVLAVGFGAIKGQ